MTTKREQTQTQTTQTTPARPQTQTKRRDSSKREMAPRRADAGRAFIPDPYDSGSSNGRARTGDALGEMMAESYVGAATSGEEQSQDDMTTDELGGPFVETAAQEEFAGTTDDMNPEDAPREPFPTANARRD